MVMFCYKRLPLLSWHLLRLHSALGLGLLGPHAYLSCLAVSAWASSNVGFALFLLPHADGRVRRGVHGFRGARGARYSRRGFGLSSA